MPVDLASIRRALPEGRTLPEELWTRRHRGILILLWAHAVFIPAFALVRGYSLVHIAFEGAVVPALALVATAPSFGRRLRSAAASFGLLSCSAVLVHLSGGVIEMHFHFFVMVAVVALYQDWICFLAAIAYVLVHHGVLGAIDPGSVFNHYAALNHPWKWAAIHAFFVAGISVACLVTWRENENLIADHAAVAVDNARLYEAEHQAREFAERAQRRLAVLADASQVLASSLDIDQILEDLADIAAPGMGDSCVVFLGGDDGALRPVVAGPADGDGSRPPPPLRGPGPTGSADAGDPIARCFQSGHSFLVDEPCADLVALAGAMAGGGPPATSGLVVALVGREGPLGALALTHVRRVGSTARRRRRLPGRGARPAGGGGGRARPPLRQPAQRGRDPPAQPAAGGAARAAGGGDRQPLPGGRAGGRHRGRLVRRARPRRRPAGPGHGRRGRPGHPRGVAHGPAPERAAGLRGRGTARRPRSSSCSTGCCATAGHPTRWRPWW